LKTGIFGFFVSSVLFSSGCAHGFFGWPPFKDSLLAKQVEPQTIDALAVGWFFGTASMLAFASVVLLQAISQIRGLPAAPGASWIVAVTYVVFGSCAFVFRDFNSHFILFVLTGVLVAIFNLLCRRSAAGATSA